MVADTCDRKSGRRFFGQTDQNLISFYYRRPHNLKWSIKKLVILKVKFEGFSPKILKLKI